MALALRTRRDNSAIATNVASHNILGRWNCCYVNPFCPFRDTTAPGARALSTRMSPLRLFGIARRADVPARVRRNGLLSLPGRRH